MYSAKLTAKVDSHHTNPDYKCLLVDLLPLKEFHYKIEVFDEKGRRLKNVNPVLVKADLIPTYEWMIALIHDMVNWKPDFREMLINGVIMGDFDK